MTAKGGTGNGGTIKACNGLNVSFPDWKPTLAMGPDTFGPRGKGSKGAYAIAKEEGGKSLEAKGTNEWETGLNPGSASRSQFGLGKGDTGKLISEARGFEDDVSPLFIYLYMHVFVFL